MSGDVHDPNERAAPVMNTCRLCGVVIARAVEAGEGDYEGDNEYWVGPDGRQECDLSRSNDVHEPGYDVTPGDDLAESLRVIAERLDPRHEDSYAGVFQVAERARTDLYRLAHRVASRTAEGASDG